ncbi:MAG: hypothetical protein AB7E13_04765 [Arcobacteraceae bacterium]
MYGITKHDLKIIQKKHDLQREYLKNSYFVSQTSGQVKSLLDVSFSANHSTRYYTEILNKINTINSLIASEINVKYQPIFITITLDGFFRDFLYADFSRYNPDLHSIFIPNNERFGYLQDKIKQNEKFTIKDLYNVLNYQLWRFQVSKPYQKIKKDGFKLHYIRVAEPHKKDGVPHFHIMLYTPMQYLESLKKTYMKYFPAKQNIKRLNNCNLGQLNGFQWKIDSAPAYILKYLFKSFLDVKNKSNLDYLQAWYIQNRILRVVTSHSLIPVWVYRKCIALEKDWHYLTYLKENFIAEWSKEDDYFKFENTFSEITIIYEKGEYKKFYKDRLIKHFGVYKEPFEKKHKLIKLKYQKPRIPILYCIDGERYFFNGNKLIKFEPVPVISEMTNSILFNYYHSLSDNIDNVNLQHFGLVKNELISREMLSGKKVSLNLYNTHLI